MVQLPSPSEPNRYVELATGGVVAMVGPTMNLCWKVNALWDFYDGSTSFGALAAAFMGYV